MVATKGFNYDPLLCLTEARLCLPARRCVLSPFYRCASRLLLEPYDILKLLALGKLPPISKHSTVSNKRNEIL